MGGPSEQSQFPIWRPEHSTASDFAQRAKRYLEGLPDWAVDIIGAVAIRPDASESTAIDIWVRQIGLGLAVLEELAIVDRHRALLVTVAVPSVQYVTSDGNADVQFHFSGDSFVVEHDMSAEAQAVWEAHEFLSDRPPRGLYLEPTWLQIPLVPSRADVTVVVTNAQHAVHEVVRALKRGTWAW